MSVTLPDLIFPVICFIICSISLILNLNLNNIFEYKITIQTIILFICWIVTTIILILNMCFYVISNLE